jgi:outer membrane protein assembly factor BamB
MKEDFVTRLELQLTKAERVQERGGPLPRLLAPVRAWRRPPLAAVGLAAALLIAIVVGAVALTRGGDHDDKVVAPRPTEAARTWLWPTADDTCTACDVSGPFSGLASGFGSAWIGGLQNRELVRLNLGSRKVQARIPVGKLATDVLVTGDAVWVVVNQGQRSSTAVRVDPERNRVTDRIAVPRLSTWPKLLGDDRAVWVLGEEKGIRIDPGRAKVAGQVSWNLNSGAFARAFGLAGDDLWVRGEDGQLLHLDAATGALKGKASSSPGAANLAVIPDGGVVVANFDGSVSRIDADTGRARWAAQPVPSIPTGESGSGRTDRTVAIAGGMVWVLTEDSQRVTERLTALDLATGRTRTATSLKDYGASTLTPIGDELWYIAPDGHAVVVQP